MHNVLLFVTETRGTKVGLHTVGPKALTVCLLAGF